MLLTDYLVQSAQALERLAQWPALDQVDRAVDVLVDALARNKPVLVFGNGGSASDAMHIAGELVGRFLKERKALNCLCLSANPAVLTAWANDYSYETVFSRQVEAHAAPGGVVFGLSTSGNSPNVITALAQGRSMGMTAIGMVGEGGGKAAAACDILIDVPSRSTPIIQQLHICIYHYICAEVERRLFS